MLSGPNWAKSERHKWQQCWPHLSHYSIPRRYSVIVVNSDTQVDCGLWIVDCRLSIVDHHVGEERSASCSGSTGKKSTLRFEARTEKERGARLYFDPGRRCEIRSLTLIVPAARLRCSPVLPFCRSALSAHPTPRDLVRTIIERLLICHAPVV